ncbi:tyrosine phosphatase family-domain-containing protein [Xylariomycetidae sp. FL2044]|nr:tyrosine phosphatase family-domain-containing protein [Xylariomycetidae sp. FL2044]
MSRADDSQHRSTDRDTDTIIQLSVAASSLRHRNSIELLTSEKLAAGVTPLAMPVNFGNVVPGVYRSGYPVAADYPFIQGLGLRTIVTLVNKELPDGFQQFMDGNGIRQKVFDMAGTKKEEIPVALMASIIAFVTDRRNHPLLIHCNHGKHRTGSVVGVLRKANEWDLERIISEYSGYAAPKAREGDIKYITDFKVSSLSIRAATSTAGAPAAADGGLSLVGRFTRSVVFAAFALGVFIYTSGKILAASRGAYVDKTIRAHVG